MQMRRHDERRHCMRNHWHGTRVPALGRRRSCGHFTYPMVTFGMAYDGTRIHMHVYRPRRAGARVVQRARVPVVPVFDVEGWTSTSIITRMNHIR